MGACAARDHCTWIAVVIDVQFILELEFEEFFCNTFFIYSVRTGTLRSSLPEVEDVRILRVHCDPLRAIDTVARPLRDNAALLHATAEKLFVSTQVS